MKITRQVQSDFFKNLISQENISNTDFIRNYQLLIEKSIAQSSKSNYQRVVELIDVCVHNSFLDEKIRSEGVLKQAIIFQENGDIKNAQKALKIYQSLKGQNLSREYYLCKGKLVSQITNNPKTLTSYLKFLEQQDTFKNSDAKKSLSSLYWRVSVLWQMQDFYQSDLYLSIHRNFVEIGSYQNAHNHQLIGLSNIIKLADEQTTVNSHLLNKSFEMLIQSFSEYGEIENFKWLNKCIASNLLMMALIDHIGKMLIRSYKKVFYVRKIFYLCKIAPNDEAISEIISVIRKAFPDVFEILFTQKISEVIRKHSLSDILREIYLQVEHEFIDITLEQEIDILSLYKYLVL
ncbi:hypothetical protein [Microcoleus sp. FACHB-672]|uniref:hypothetical protein n=1 Tax=Microcoleus sp. FACHB-672 TaxID=2692825 RepID=UPI001683B9DB|nr:hypothetical protein [Microcoleus sp. FACHB-672]MBD2043769.1 hypothetical protein [Microcoleus sp. FACHB-672]